MKGETMQTMDARRQEAIESGVRNAVDTVLLDKSMTRDQAYAQLADFVSDGLSAAGLDDRVSAEEIEFARRMFPI